MKEIPILFSTPMVQAILDGKKSMTRRVIKLKPLPGAENLSCYHGVDEWRQVDGGFQPWGDPGMCVGGMEPKYDAVKCPYGQPSDRLWVRETWTSIENDPYDHLENYPDQGSRIIYKASTQDSGRHHWKPSIHMPKAAARIWLEVVSVRVERLQDITEEDAWAEGVKDPYEYQPPEYYEQSHMRGIEINKSAFAGLWDSINAKRGYGWNENPWVWVVEFRRIEK